nr:MULTISPECIES: hypothetical protein [Halostella]
MYDLIGVSPVIRTYHRSFPCYFQREYVVNPMQFFEDLAPYLEDGSIEGLRVHDVRVRRLLKGNSGKRHYENLVVSHDDRYVAAIEAFVEAGGNLVLTDSGYSCWVCWMSATLRVLMVTT